MATTPSTTPRRRFSIEPLEERITPGFASMGPCGCFGRFGFQSQVQSQFQSQFQSQSQFFSFAFSFSGTTGTSSFAISAVA